MAEILTTVVADYSELLRDQLMNKASDPDGVTLIGTFWQVKNGWLKC